MAYVTSVLQSATPKREVINIISTFFNQRVHVGQHIMVEVLITKSLMKEVNYCLTPLMMSYKERRMLLYEAALSSEDSQGSRLSLSIT